MTLALTQTATAVAANIGASFLAVNGTAPYAYAVSPGGAGGTINSSTGVYAAPSVAPSDPSRALDTIVATDARGNKVASQILVGTPLLLFCDIIQRRLGLANGRVYLWDQKIMQPTDSGLYVAVSVLRCRPFANGNLFQSAGMSAGQSSASVNMGATLDINVISRGPEARDRKEEVIIALMSTYSRQQQDANSFYIAGLPSQFLNLSQVDGAAIPYRFQISVNIMYAVTLTTPDDYFDTISKTIAVDA